MTTGISSGLNRLPRLSYRWLQLNEFGFRDPVQLPVQEYSLNYLPNKREQEIVLTEMTKLEDVPLLTRHSFGVSQELVEFGEKHYNAGFYLSVPAGKTIQEPLQIRYKLSNDNSSVVDYNVIVAQKNSRITINVEYLGVDSARGFHNGITKVIAEEGAEVTLIKVQRLNDTSLHFDSHYIEAGPYATVRYVQVELGSGHSITNYVANLADNSSAVVDSMYFGDGNQVLDLSYHMLHHGHRSKSDILVKGALKDNSKKVFRGTLDFKRGASLADGNEEEYVLLLDPTVKSDAVPLLLSEEDDVQGGHAASAGKVDPDQLFYLMSRGLSAEEAIQVIVKAAYQPILAQLPQEQQSAILTDLNQRLVQLHV